MKPNGRTRKTATDYAKDGERRKRRRRCDGGDGAGADNSPRQSQAEALLALAAAAEYFHAADGKAFARVPIDGSGPKAKRDTVAVRGADFRNWLCRSFYKSTGKAPSTKGMQDALGVLQARARYDGPCHEVFVRVAGGADVIVIDLCDEAWRAAEVSAAGWRVLDAHPTRFRRPRGAAALPAPVPGGRLGRLWDFVNVRKEDRILVVAWLASAARPQGPYPVLCLHGEQASAKSTAARVLRGMIDPSVALLRAAPRDERDLIISASNCWVMALDNLSSLDPWLSDALCRLSTGGGFATRELYSDSDEAIFDVQRPVLLTGIEDLAHRADLMDRAIILRLPPISEEKRRPERAIFQEFEAERPALLGALLDAVAGGLRLLPQVQLDGLPRMADFALWGEAVCQATGCRPGALLDAYEVNQAEADGLVLENSPIPPLLKALLAAAGGSWQGSCQDLLAALKEHRGNDRSPAGWPKTPRGLSGILKRLAPSLRRDGIAVEFAHRTREGRPVTVRRCEGKRSREDRHNVHTDTPGDGGECCDGAGANNSPWDPPAEEGCYPGGGDF